MKCEADLLWEEGRNNKSYFTTRWRYNSLQHEILDRLSYLNTV